MISEPISQYSTKTPEYFSGARVDFISRLPNNNSAKILEIGCSYGGTGALALSQGKCGSYTGIDIKPQAIEIAKSKLSKVILTDLDTNFSEIFEHLRDPWTVLAKLIPLLKPGAILLASSPNIAHKSIIRNLRKGDFNYEDIGVMDRTHLRWFTPNSFQELFSEAGLIITDLFPISPLKSCQKLAAMFIPNGQKTHWRQICIEARKP